MIGILEYWNDGRMVWKVIPRGGRWDIKLEIWHYLENYMEG